MTGRQERITHNTLIPVSLVIVFLSACAWLTTMHNKIETLAEASTSRVERDGKICERLLKIEQALFEIQGELKRIRR